MILRNIKFLTWFYLLILVLGSVLPLNSGTALNNTYVVEIRSDYLIHLLVMLPLPVLIGFSLRNLSGNWVRVLVLGLLIVVLCEGVQLLIPYRTFNINDLIANGVGALIGLIPALLIWHRYKKTA